MSQCIVLNVTEVVEWIDQRDPDPRGMRAQGLHVPPKYRPTLVHTTRAEAEKEAARLACQSGGEFAVFELLAVCKGKALADTDRVRGLGPCSALIPRWDDEAGLEI
jgi:hypothetical protein